MAFVAAGVTALGAAAGTGIATAIIGTAASLIVGKITKSPILGMVAGFAAGAGVNSILSTGSTAAAGDMASTALSDATGSFGSTTGDVSSLASSGILDAASNATSPLTSGGLMGDVVGAAVETPIANLPTEGIESVFTQGAESVIPQGESIDLFDSVIQDSAGNADASLAMSGKDFMAPKNPSFWDYLGTSEGKNTMLQMGGKMLSGLAQQSMYDDQMDFQKKQYKDQRERGRYGVKNTQDSGAAGISPGQQLPTQAPSIQNTQGGLFGPTTALNNVSYDPELANQEQQQMQAMSDQQRLMREQDIQRRRPSGN